MRIKIITGLFLTIALSTNAQIDTDSVRHKKYQATPPSPQAFDAEEFQNSGETVIRWMGNGGFFINSRRTTLMVDPLLKGFDMPVLFNVPLDPKEVPHLDAVLITHSDFGVTTL